MKFLLDSNTFIQAKNSYYSMAICPGFWDWLLHSNTEHGVCSIDLVKKELDRGDDDLTKWAQNNSHIFLPVSDEKTQQIFKEVADYVMSSGFKEAVKNDFLGGADPWLIAKAKATDTIIVTHEQYNEEAKRKIFIPNICQQFNVPYINTFEMLNTLKAQFVLRNIE